ncbi:MAG: CCE_0567 family metalloprotein [Pseudomonadota bacterium]|nr:CCE_0567 family metalloprotein [Pseudomonadota bacterium]
MGRPGVADLDDLKAQAKKLNAKATQAKMDLHDLSEELPTNWEQILEIAQRAHDAHAALMAVRQQLAAATPA